jgi:hypothetical protein
MIYKNINEFIKNYLFRNFIHIQKFQNYFNLHSNRHPPYQNLHSHLNFELYSNKAFYLIY